MNHLGRKAIKFCALIQGVILIGVLLFTISSCQIVSLEENERGVVFERFNGGLNKDIIYGSGPQIFSMWDRLVIYDIDTTTQNQILNLSFSENRRFEIDLLLKYKLIPDRIGYLEEEIGRNYYQSIILPEIEASFLKRSPLFNVDSYKLIQKEKLGNELLKEVFRPIQRKYIEMLSIEIATIFRLE